MRPIAAAALTLILASSASAARVRVEAVADRTAVEPGGKLVVALIFAIDPGWHLYWHNPGDTGDTPHARWTLSQGVLAGPLRFPTPHRIDAEGLTAFGYEDRLVLLCDVTVPADAAGSVSLSADLQWIVCKEECLSETQSVAIELPVGPGVAKDAERFAAWKAQQPERPAMPTPVGCVVYKNGKVGNFHVRVPPDRQAVDFFPPKADFLAYDKPDADRSQFLRTPFRVLSGAPKSGSGLAVVVWKDPHTGRVWSEESNVSFDLTPAGRQSRQPATTPE